MQLPTDTGNKKLPFWRITLLIFAYLLTSCTGTKDYDGSTLLIDRSDVRSWNPMNLWAECANAPSHYFPRGMKKGTRLDDEHGHWVDDPADDARFYIPNDGTPEYSRQSLERMAKNATNRKSKTAVFLYLLLKGALGAARGPLGPY